MSSAAISQAVPMAMNWLGRDQGLANQNIQKPTKTLKNIR